MAFNELRRRLGGSYWLHQAGDQQVLQEARSRGLPVDASLIYVPPPPPTLPPAPDPAPPATVKPAPDTMPISLAKRVILPEVPRDITGKATAPIAAGKPVVPRAVKPVARAAAKPTSSSSSSSGSRVPIPSTYAARIARELKRRHRCP